MHKFHGEFLFHDVKCDITSHTDVDTNSFNKVIFNLYLPKIKIIPIKIVDFHVYFFSHQQFASTHPNLALISLIGTYSKNPIPLLRRSPKWSSCSSPSTNLVGYPFTQNLKPWNHNEANCFEELYCVLLCTFVAIHQDQFRLRAMRIGHPHTLMWVGFCITGSSSRHVWMERAR